MSTSKATKNMGTEKAVKTAVTDLSAALAEVLKGVFGEKHVKYAEKAIQAISSEDFQDKMASIVKKNIKVKESKGKKLKDPEAPKGKRSSYILFCSEERESVKADNKGIANKDILVELGVRWANLSDKKKKKFQKLAEKDAERHKSEMADYTPSDEFKAKVEAAGVGKKTKKAKKEGPKRACSAYIFFCAAERPKVKEEHSEMDSKEVTSELGKRWKALDDDDKEEYNEQAAEAKEKYLKEKEAWDADHPKDEKAKPKTKKSSSAPPSSKSKKTSDKSSSSSESTSPEESDESDEELDEESDEKEPPSSKKKSKPNKK